MKFRKRGELPLLQASDTTDCACLLNVMDISSMIVIKLLQHAKGGRATNVPMVS